ncbi:MAG TPA: hypothetical protein DDZ51_05030 [Planctomycetaceae bacterium]|nr:hypothetical protein [Planctomycetaceae bacterium]
MGKDMTNAGGGAEVDGPTLSSSSNLTIWSRYKEALFTGFTFYYLSTVLVVLGVAFGTELIPRRNLPSVNQNDPGLPHALANWDGVWYARIVRDGYEYNPQRASSVAFFPLYPVMGKALTLLAPISEEVALLVVSHASLLALFSIVFLYVHDRYGDSQKSSCEWVLLGLAFWPITFFMRMAYTESLFVLLLVAALFAMNRGFPVLVVAFIVGLATGCRSAGVALVLPFVWYLWQQSRGWNQFAIKSLFCLPLSIWGLVAYMVYQHFQFGDALAFVKTQSHWVARQPESLGQYVIALATLEPIWSKFDPNSFAYWRRFDSSTSELFSFEVANPIYFVLTAALVGVGWWKRWLNSYEVLLSIGLLGVPYLSHSYRIVMMGHARFASSVFPVYLVLGHLLSRAPPTLAAVILAIWAAFLVLYSALFASWHRVF